jgi:hypothetical protein
VNEAIYYSGMLNLRVFVGNKMSKRHRMKFSG